MTKVDAPAPKRIPNLDLKISRILGDEITAKGKTISFGRAVERLMQLLTETTQVNERHA